MVTCVSIIDSQPGVCKIHSPNKLIMSITPDYIIKTMRLDNSRTASQTFNDYCMSVGITAEYLVAHVQIQNGLAKSFLDLLIY